MRVPYLDLPRQWADLEDELLPRLLRVYSRAAFVLGPEVEEFERAFAAYCGCAEAVGVGSGLDALKLALRALGVGPGDEVVTVANTFIATALAVTAIGARPVLVDAEPETCNLDVGALEDALGERTRAIVPVHLYGQPADMDRVNEIAARHGVPVLEDASHAHGATYHDRRTGGLGAIAAFSLYPGKNLGATGDAGVVTTGDPELAERVRLLRNYGSRRKYEHLVLGENSRLDGVHATVLTVKLARLDAWNRRRQEVAARYTEGLAGVGDLVLPRVAAGNTHVYHVYGVRTARRAELIRHLERHEIQTNVNFPTPVHLHEAYADHGWREGDFPVAERLCREVLSLPVFPEMSDEQADWVIDRVRAFFA